MLFCINISLLFRSICWLFFSERLPTTLIKIDAFSPVIMGDLPFERIPRDLLVRCKAKTSDKFGMDPQKRPIKTLLTSGVVVIDKPSGPTSHQVSAYVKQILHIGKAGHSGTLDPKVTGILPVALDKGTRIVQSLLVAGKEYICLMRLHQEKSKDEVLDLLKEFSGKIRQLPPVKSAVKRQWRKRNVYYNELLDIQGPNVLFKVGCQAGTYIRKLCSDMGDKLGCGAHMAQLRRSKAGPFKEVDLVTLHDLTDAYAFYKEDGDESYLRKCILPLENAVGHLPKVYILDSAIRPMSQGATLKTRGIVSVESNIQVDEDVAVMSLKGELVCVGAAKMISKDMVRKQMGVAVKSKQVFMQPDVYPKM